MNKNNKTIWCFIINPTAGKGKVAKRWSVIKPQLKYARIEFSAHFTQYSFHATKIVSDRIEQGHRHFVAVGGDGTAHDVINGIFNQKSCPPEEITFALLPIGTGNDWVKTHHIPRKFPHWLKTFQGGNTKFQDVGLLHFQKNGKTEKRYFINVAGLSYDGYVVKKLAHSSSRLPGFLHYMWATLKYLIKFRIPPVRVFFNGKKIEGKFYTINIGICRYSGGGMQLVPQAIPDDGLLALTVARKISKLGVLLSSPLFYLGKIGWHPKASLFSTDKVKVEPISEMPVQVEADGEYLGEAPVQVEILKKKLRILVP